MKRASITLLGCLLALLAANSSPAQAADNETPVLISFSIVNETAAAAGDAVNVKYEVQEPGGSGIQTVIFYFMSPVAGTIQVRADAPDAADGPATFVVPEFAPAGTYALESIDISDADGNFASYQANGTVTVSPGGATGPGSHSFIFADHTFDVVNANEDVTAATISAFTLGMPGPFAPGDTVTVDFAALDGDSGLSTVLFYFRDIIGQTRQVRVDGPAIATGTASGPVDTSWAAGAYVLEFITLIDNAGNSTDYAAGGTIIVNPFGIAGPASPHPFDFSLTMFTVDNPNSDIATPVLTSFDIAAPRRFLSGTEISASYVASDPGAGLATVIFYFADEFDNLHQLIALGAEAPAGPATAIVEQNWTPGRYTLQAIILFDAAGIAVSYNRDGTVVPDPQGATGPGSPHSFAFEDFDIVVITSGADTSCNGSLGIEDALQLRRVVAALATPIAPCGVDMNGDGAALAEDALFLLQILAGMADDFPPGSR